MIQETHVTYRTTSQSFHRDQLHPFANPPADFEIRPNDFDIDAELLTADHNQSTGFELRAKEDPNGNYTN